MTYLASLHSSHFFYHVDFIAVVRSTLLRRYRIRFDRVVILYEHFASHLNTASPPYIYLQIVLYLPLRLFRISYSAILTYMHNMFTAYIYQYWIFYVLLIY